MEHNNRGQWGSNFGFLMAAIGSAVGLGNIWGFPFKMGASGGFPFLIIYLLLGVLIGFPILLTELAIGRKAGSSVIESYRSVGGPFGAFIGALAMLSPFLILSFYTVLGGYCLQYISLNIGELTGLFSSAGLTGTETFANMRANQMQAILFTYLFIIITFLIIRGGIQGGIEKFNKIGMPALFVMLLVVIVRAVTLPGAAEGLKFMFAPNFDILQHDFIKVLSTAGGQMFFSLSLAMGITVTYGSYLSKKESLVQNSLVIIVSDTIVAVLAGVAVLPAAFALGGPDAALSGPGLLYITLQDVFNHMGPLGPIFGILFYVLVALAAITSTIALDEVLVTFFMDRAALKGKTPSRIRMVSLVTLAVMLESTLVAADGLGANNFWIPFQELGLNLSASWLDFMDFISEGVAMPLGALLMSVLVGWVIGPRFVKDEVEQSGHTMGSGLYRYFQFCIRIAAPLGMAFILYGQIHTFLSPIG